ncbi:hypothetical protein [uncultured Friedmanniella sp.]|uniref:hypothetical protein n=1 Tax=uncultured Friedmanniella sp. TaxID=335381 RepID=UPI0035CAD609
MTAFPQQPPAYPSISGGELVIEARRPFGGGGLMMSPQITIDGYPAPAVWGRNAYPAPAGRRHVQVATNYLWRFGGAETDVDVFPGQSSVVHYSGPLITFIGGRIGPQVQPRAGMAAFWAIMGLVLLLVVLAVVGAVLDR